MKKATPLLSANGQQRYVTSMAGGGSLRLMQCGECGDSVAWAQSSKTGKWYLCETVEYTTEAGHGAHKAQPWMPHYKQCGKNIEAADENRRIVEAEHAYREYMRENGEAYSAAQDAWTDAYVEAAKAGETAPEMPAVMRQGQDLLNALRKLMGDPLYSVRI
jgi:hypothetical protein